MRVNDFRTLLEGFNDIEEAGTRDPSIDYKEEGKSKADKVIGDITKVTAMVKGTTSEKLTKLSKRYLVLDRATKEFTKRRELVKEEEMRPIFDLLFAAEDAALTRVIETVSLTVQMGKDVEASTTEEEVLDTEKFMGELIQLLDKDLIPVVLKLKEKHTKLEKKVKKGKIGAITQPKMKKESIVHEGVADTLKKYMSQLLKWTQTELMDFDEDFAQIQQNYNGRRPKF